MSKYCAIVLLDDGETAEIHFRAKKNEDIMDAAKWEAIDLGLRFGCVDELYLDDES